MFQTYLLHHPAIPLGLPSRSQLDPIRLARNGLVTSGVRVQASSQVCQDSESKQLIVQVPVRGYMRRLVPEPGARVGRVQRVSPVILLL